MEPLKRKEASMNSFGNKQTAALLNGTRQPDRLLRLADVCAMVGLKKSTVYALENFPPRIRLSRRAVAWRESDITRWIAAREQVNAGAEA